MSDRVSLVVYDRDRPLELQIEELSTKLIEIERERDRLHRSLVSVRKQLEPLYRALRLLFGDLDEAGVGVDWGASPASSTSNARPTSPVWEAWKARLGIGAAKCIDALLLHGELNTQQLAIATGYHRNTVPQYVSALNKAGLVDKRDGKFSLKAL